MPGIGNAIGIPFKKGGGISWSTYWASLISATVENAAPTNVVLTFPSAKPELVSTDFTVTVNAASVAVNSASWAGAVLTLVINDTIIYGDVIVVTFVVTGGTANVTNNVVLDANAATFITATGVTDETQKAAVNEFVIDLKAINAVQANFVNFVTPASSILRAVYPFIGTTADNHKWNLIDPQDADASFRLHFLNDHAEAHTADGYISNGSDQAADTHLIPNTHLSVNNTHIANYTDATAGMYGYIGCYSGASAKMWINSLSGTVEMYTDANAIVYTPADTAFGFTVGSRTGVNYSSLFKNGKKVEFYTGASTGTLPTVSVWITGRNHTTTPMYLADKCGYASLGAGITDAANILYGAAVKKLMIALGRRTADVASVTAGVALSLDDLANIGGWTETTWLSAMYGFKFTAALQGNTFTGGNLTEIQKDILNGCSVASHGLNHISAITYLLTHTAQEYYDDEVAPNVTAINAAYGITCKSFAYPLSEHVASVTTVLLANGITFLRSAPYYGGEVNTVYDGTNQLVLSDTLDNVTYTIDEYKTMIDAALTGNWVLCLHGHTLDNDANTTSISYARLKELCEYINSKGMKFYTYDELLSSIFS